MNIHKYIANIAEDKKRHLILGLLQNPFIIIVITLLGFAVFGNALLFFRLSVLVAILFHLFIEVYQYVTKSGKFELLDWFCGSLSAISIWLVVEIILKIV